MLPILEIGHHAGRWPLTFVATFPAFSVRGLIVAVLVFGGWLGWIVRGALGSSARRWRRSRMPGAWCGITSISRAMDSRTTEARGHRGGSSVGWADHLDTVTVVHLGPDIVHRDPAYRGPVDHRNFGPILTQVARLDHLEWLDVSLASVTDADLARLERLSSLRRLELRGTDVTDAGLANLKALTSLGCLELQGTKITDAGLYYLDRITGLEILSLDRTRITDAGLVRLKNQRNLRLLSLRKTDVADTGLAQLKSLTKLSDLYLQETKVTDAGVKELQQALPSLTIIR